MDTKHDPKNETDRTSDQALFELAARKGVRIYRHDPLDPKKEEVLTQSGWQPTTPRPH